MLEHVCDKELRELREEIQRLRAILDDHCCDDEMCPCQDPALNTGVEGSYGGAEWAAQRDG